MSRRLALGLLAAASPSMLLSLCIDAPLAGWAFALLVLGFPVALAGLGTARPAGRRAPRWPLALLAVALAGSGIGVLSTSGAAAPNGGLPPGTTILLWGFGPVTLLVVVAGYAATFDRTGIPVGTLRRIRRSAREPACDAGPAAGDFGRRGPAPAVGDAIDRDTEGGAEDEPSGRGRDGAGDRP